VRGEDITAANLRPIDTGPGQSVQLRRIAVEGPGANAPPEVHPMTSHSIQPHAVNVPPGIATVPGQQSASAAAPAALDQMRATAGAATPEVPQTNLQVKQPQKTASGEEPPTPPPGPTAGEPPQAAVQPPQAAVPGAPSTAPVTGPAAAAAQSPPAAQTGPEAGGKVKFLLSSPGPVKPGSSFQIPVVISGAADIGSVPLQIQYDAEKLSLVNVGPGDFLSRDGQSVALVHRDDGPGTLTVNASRPPGAPGMNGAGVVCMLTFQAKAAGSTMVVITKPGAMSSAQKPVPALGAQLSVDVK
jgi:general secretion pathway protein D